MSQATSQTRVSLERAKLLFAQTRLMALLGMLGILAKLLLSVFADSVHAVLLIWALTSSALIGGTLFVAQQCMPCQSELEVHRALKLYARLVIPLGAVWGFLPLVHYTGIGVPVNSFIELVLLMFVSILGIIGYGIYPVLYRQFLAATALSLGLSSVLFWHVSHVVVIALCALGFPVLLLFARHYSDIVNQALEQSAKAEDLVQELTVKHAELEQSQRELAASMDVMQQEAEIATHIFKQLVLSSDSEIPGIHSWNQPMGNMSGDIIQVSVGPKGQTYVFLGDFTGHGLPAALGAVPASSVFRAMVQKGLAVETIARELNYKLFTLLPTGYFCCAVLIEMPQDRSYIRIWNGGLPPVAMQNSAKRSLVEFASKNLPLGIVDDNDFLTQTEHLKLHSKDRIYLYTDGLTEAQNIDGEMWGRERVIEFLSWHDFDQSRMQELKLQIMDFVNLAPPSDDVSIVEIEVTPTLVS